MKKRVELNEEMMEHVIGGRYFLYVRNPETGDFTEFIDSYTYQDSLWEAVHAINGHGADVYVRADFPWFGIDDKTLQGIYTSTGEFIPG